VYSALQSCSPQLPVLKELFSLCDLDNKGWITQTELQHLCNHFDISNQRSSSDASSVSLFQFLDKDNDDKIDFHEFAQGFTEYLNAVEHQADDAGSTNKNNNESVIEDLSYTPSSTAGSSGDYSASYENNRDDDVKGLICKLLTDLQYIQEENLRLETSYSRYI
jgi:hypothetical protein